MFGRNKKKKTIADGIGRELHQQIYDAGQEKSLIAERNLQSPFVAGYIIAFVQGAFLGAVEDSQKTAEQYLKHICDGVLPKVLYHNIRGILYALSASLEMGRSKEHELFEQGNSVGLYDALQFESDSKPAEGNLKLFLLGKDLHYTDFLKGPGDDAPNNLCDPVMAPDDEYSRRSTPDAANVSDVVSKLSLSNGAESLDRAIALGKYGGNSFDRQWDNFYWELWQAQEYSEEEWSEEVAYLAFAALDCFALSITCGAPRYAGIQAREILASTRETFLTCFSGRFYEIEGLEFCEYIDEFIGAFEEAYFSVRGEGLQTETLIAQDAISRFSECWDDLDFVALVSRWHLRRRHEFFLKVNEILA